MSYHHHHHHNGEEGYYGEAYEGERVYATQPYVGESYERFDSSYVREGEGDRRRAPFPPPPQHHVTNYQRNERLGELGAVAAGAFALYEGHKATTDPAHGSKHKQEAEVAGGAALASGGYAAYENREKEKYSNDYRW